MYHFGGNDMHEMMRVMHVGMQVGDLIYLELVSLYEGEICRYQYQLDLDL